MPRDLSTTSMKNKWFIVIPSIIAIFIIVGVSSFYLGRFYRDTRPVMKVGEHDIASAEYDFFYYSYRMYYLSAYSSFFEYMGVDVNLPIDDQIYEDGKTFRQKFTEETVNQIKETYALYDEGIKNGFEFDTGKALDSYMSDVNATCDAANMTVDEYFKQAYGEKARPSLIKKYLKMGFYKAAYYDSLCEGSDVYEVNVRVNELKKSYQVTYY